LAQKTLKIVIASRSWGWNYALWKIYFWIYPYRLWLCF